MRQRAKQLFQPFPGKTAGNIKQVINESLSMDEI
jgi:hypothetical protein